MNILIVAPSITLSVSQFAQVDPRRARKQLVECCQILACVDILRGGATTMTRADGALYKPTLAQMHHPVCVACLMSSRQYIACVTLASCLAWEFPGHASASSFREWHSKADVPPAQGGGFLCVRRGMPHKLVNTVEEYAEIMRAYWRKKLGEA